MTDKKYYKDYWGGSRKAGSGKTDGRPTNESKGLPTVVKKQFILYPADLAVMAALLAKSEGGNGSALVRGLIRQATRLSVAEMAEVVALGKSSTAEKKQFLLYPSDLASMAALLAKSEVGNGSALIRGLIQQAARLSAAEVAEVVALGKPPAAKV